MHCMHIINAILNYKKCNLNYRGAIFGWERLCIVDQRFYFDGGAFVSIQSLRGEISYQSRRDSVSGETLFRYTGAQTSRRPNVLLRTRGPSSDAESEILLDLSVM